MDSSKPSCGQLCDKLFRSRGELAGQIEPERAVQALGDNRVKAVWSEPTTVTGPVYSGPPPSLPWQP